jgi:glutaminase
MPAHAEAETATEPCYVSTGHLPDSDLVMTTVKRAYERFKGNTEGTNSDVYPALARVPGDLFGVCVVGTSGNVYAAGDADHEFSIMSVSKPFVFALVCQCLGAEEARDRLGVNSTGLPFNALAAIERGQDGRTNPMVNPGAIATTSLVPGATADARWQFIHDGLSRFAGRTLPLNAEAMHRHPKPISEIRVLPVCCRAMVGSISIRRKRPISTRNNVRSTCRRAISR